MAGGIQLPKLPGGISLVDYGNDEEDGEGSGGEDGGTRTPPEGDVKGGVMSSGSGGGLRKTASFTDLRSLGSGSLSPERKPTLDANGDVVGGLMGMGSPPRMSEKRRRDDDDEEAFGRLAAAASNSKGQRKAALDVKLGGGSVSSKAPSKAAGNASATTSGSGPVTKKIRLSFSGNKKFGLQPAGDAAATAAAATASSSDGESSSTPPAGPVEQKDVKPEPSA